MYKLIVSGFDGCLIDDEGRIPLSTVLLLDKLRRSGIKIVITTGRCLKSVLYYNRDFPICDYLITSNGAYVYDVALKKAIYKKNVSIRIVRKIIKEYKKKAMIYLTDHNTWNLMSEKSDNLDDFDVEKILDIEKFLEENKKNIYKIELHFKTLTLAKNCLKEIEKLELKINVNLQVSKDKFIVEITNSEATQVKGVEKVLSKEKLEMQDVIAFGCGYNNLELLKKVGLGVALETAQEEVKKVADDQTLDHNSKGVENYLKKIF